MLLFIDSCIFKLLYTIIQISQRRTYVARECLVRLQPALGGSWVVISGVISYTSPNISIVTLLIKSPNEGYK